MTNEERRQLSTRVRNLLNGYSIDGDQITWIAVDAEEMLVKVGLNTGVPENLPEKFEGTSYSSREEVEEFAFSLSRSSRRSAYIL